MGNEHLNLLAKELKEAREKSKLTIDQIFIKTRIDKKYLNAIEDGNFSIMPEVYIRAFIREYSKSVGLNPEEVMNKYDAARQGKIYSESKSEESSEKELPKEKTVITDTAAHYHDASAEVPELLSKKNISLYYIVGAISMLLAIIVIYRVFLSEDDNTIITEKPFEEIVDEQERKQTLTENTESDDEPNMDLSSVQPKALTEIEKISAADEKTAEIVQQPLREGEMTLTVVAEGESWMRVVSDEKNNVEFIIQKGMTKVFNAREKFYLHIGNSGSIKLYLNNEDMLFRRSPGKVRKVFITEDGIEYLRRTPTLNVEQE